MRATCQISCTETAHSGSWVYRVGMVAIGTTSYRQTNSDVPSGHHFHFSMRQAVLTVSEVCSWKPHTGNKWSYSRGMMAAKSSSLEAEAANVALPWHHFQTPASSQEICERINCKMCERAPHCNKLGDSFSSPSVNKRMQNRQRKGTSSAHKNFLFCKILNPGLRFQFL